MLPRALGSSVKTISNSTTMLNHIPVKANPKTNIVKVEPAKKSSTYIENQLYKHLRKFLILSQIFLCAPIGAHHIDGLEQKTFKQRLVQALHVIWCILVYILLSFCVYGEYTEMSVNLPSVQLPLFFCEYLIYEVHVVQIIAKLFYARHKYRSFLIRFIDFDRRFLEFGAELDYHRFNGFCNWHFFLLVVHFMSIILANLYFDFDTLLLFLRSITVYIIPNAILQLSLLQYYALLNGIARRAARLNEVLRVELIKSGPELHINLHRLRSLSSHLDLFAKEVNYAFGPSVILVYIGSYAISSFNIFLIYKDLDSPPEKVDPARTSYSVIWVIMHFSKMFLILLYNHRYQVQKSGTVQLLSGFKIQNTELEETMTRYILQLLVHTRSNFVCGVAILSLEFLKSILSSVSALFIFLVQYDITFEALTKNQNFSNAHNSNRS